MTSITALPPIYALGDDVWKCIAAFITVNDVVHLLTVGEMRLAARIQRSIALLDFRVSSGFLDLRRICQFSARFSGIEELSIATESDWTLPLELSAPLLLPSSLVVLRMRFKHCPDLMKRANLHDMVPNLLQLDLEGLPGSREMPDVEQLLPPNLETLRLQFDGLTILTAHIKHFPLTLTSLSLCGLSVTADEEHFDWPPNLLHLALFKSIFPLEVLPRALRSLDLQICLHRSNLFAAKLEATAQLYSEFPWRIYFPFLHSLALPEVLETFFDHLFSTEAPLSDSAQKLVSSLPPLLPASHSSHTRISSDNEVAYQHMQKLATRFPYDMKEDRYKLYAKQFASIELCLNDTSVPAYYAIYFPKMKKYIDPAIGHATKLNLPPSLTYMHTNSHTYTEGLPASLTHLSVAGLAGTTPLPPLISLHLGTITLELAALLPTSLTSLSTAFGLHGPPTRPEDAERTDEIWHQIATRLPLLQELTFKFALSFPTKLTPLCATALQQLVLFFTGSITKTCAVKWLSHLLDPSASSLPPSLTRMELLAPNLGLHHSTLALLPRSLKHFKMAGASPNPDSARLPSAEHLRDASLANVFALLPPGLVSFVYNTMAQSYTSSASTRASSTDSLLPIDPVELFTALPRSLNNFTMADWTLGLQGSIEKDDALASKIAAALPPNLSAFELCYDYFTDSLLNYEYFVALHPERFWPFRERPDKNSFGDFF